MFLNHFSTVKILFCRSSEGAGNGYWAHRWIVKDILRLKCAILQALHSHTASLRFSHSIRVQSKTGRYVFIGICLLTLGGRGGGGVTTVSGPRSLPGFWSQVLSRRYRSLIHVPSGGGGGRVGTPVLSQIHALGCTPGLGRGIPSGWDWGSPSGWDWGNLPSWDWGTSPAGSGVSPSRDWGTPTWELVTSQDWLCCMPLTGSHRTFLLPPVSKG